MYHRGVSVRLHQKLGGSAERSKDEGGGVFPVDISGVCQCLSSAYRLMTAMEPDILPRLAPWWADSRGSFRAGSPLQTVKIGPASESILGASRAELGMFQRLTPRLQISFIC